MQKTFFSIIIPTLNEEKFLPGILKNLSKQKEKNFEVIIVDGLSIDETKKAAEEFNKQLSIKFFSVNKQNVSYQRNYGAKKAIGQYLIFLDADVGISRSFIKTVNYAVTKEKGLIILPYVLPEEVNPQTKIIFALVNYLIEISQFLGKPFSTGGSIITDKNLFLSIGGFSEKVFLAEDHEYIQEAAKWGVRAKFSRKIKIIFSLRRMKKEGELKLFYKYLLATAHILLKGKINKKIFKYDMGGHFYLEKKKKEKPEELLKKYLKQIKVFFRQFY